MMKVTIAFDQSIIGGFIKREICDIFPEIEKSFIQRKMYDEYYFTSTPIEITIEKLEELRNEYSFTFENTFLIIKTN